MKIHVLLSPHSIDELYFTGKTSVIIDVLRATSVISHALTAGAKEIIPVGSIDFAMKISGSAQGGHTLLCGERNTKIIEGFDLGNSPTDFSTEVVKGKSIILYTTNGSKSLVKAKFSENLFACSFNNISSLARHLCDIGKDVEILCSGSNGLFCIEDTVCAGRLVEKIIELKNDVEVSDAAKASLVLNKEFGGNLRTMLADCEHGKLLIDNGFENDLDYCSSLDATDVIPYFDNGSLKAYRTQNEEKK